MPDKIKQPNVKDLSKEEGKKYKGAKEVDQKPKEDVIIASKYPEMIKTKIYKKNVVVSFELADKNSVIRSYEEKAVSKSLRAAFPDECRSFIWSKFDGNLQEYIADQKDIEVSEVFVLANSVEAIDSIPSVIRTSGSRNPKADIWA